MMRSADLVSRVSLFLLVLFIGLAQTAAPQRPAVSKRNALPGKRLWCGIDLLPRRVSPRARRIGAATPFTESEPNDTQATANFVPLGFGAGEDVSFTISGALDALPAPTPGSVDPEDNGSIPLATSTGLIAGGSGSVTGSSMIDSTPITGDFDFFSVPANTGQTILVDIDTLVPFGDLDPVVAVWSSAGERLAFNDDGDLSVSFDSFLLYTAVADDTYYISVSGFSFPFPFPLDPFDSGSGLGVGSTGNYVITIGLDIFATDFFAFDLEAGDIVAARGTAGSPTLGLLLREPGGGLRMGSLQPLIAAPTTTNLPTGGDVGVSQVIEAAGTYALAVTFGEGAYQVDLQVHRPGLRATPTGTRQILFLDFDGATVDVSIWLGGPPDFRSLSPLSAFLGNWGGMPSAESAVIDAIVAVVEENLSGDMRAGALNGDYSVSGIPGEFDIEIRNSRDHPDPIGVPNVSRIIVGGTILETDIATIGIAQSIDIGNFDTEEIALVLLDSLSSTNPMEPFSINNYAIQAPATKIEFVGRAVGNIIAHEAGHYFGCYHTFQFNASNQIMDQGGNIEGIFGLGPDSIFGTSDDEDVDFGTDIYANEGYTGVQNTLAAVSFGLSTGGAVGGNAARLWKAYK